MQVHSTTDYGKFKFIKGNRPINTIHLNRLINSVATDGMLFWIMVVNEKLEIIDGQHRYTICKNGGLPIHYVIKKGYGISEVHILNQTTKNWSLTQFMDSFADQRKMDYEVYRNFKRQYKFNHNEVLALLTGIDHNPSKNDIEAFKKGDFKVKNLKEATCIADKIHSFAPYYDGYNRRRFIFAIIKLIRKVPAYDHKRMLQKLSYQSAKLQHQTHVEHYLSILEDIYNYRSRSERVIFLKAA
jgi:hypothetical protein